MEKNDDKDKMLYVIAVMRYKEEHPMLNENNMFSPKWILCEDYQLKNKIIASAIKEHVLVEETDLYKQCVSKGIL